MMADDASTTVTETPEAPAEDAAPKADAEAAAPAAKAAPAAPAPPAEEEAPAELVPDAESCKALAIGLDALWDGALSGKWDGSEFEYYLEPAGVLNGPLVCTRAPEDDPQRAGLLMTRAAWKTKTLFLADGVNPETYELSFPKEFGYVKPLSHYKPETRENAKFPWSKRY